MQTLPTKALCPNLSGGKGGKYCISQSKINDLLSCEIMIIQQRSGQCFFFFLDNIKV